MAISVFFINSKRAKEENKITLHLHNPQMYQFIPYQINHSNTILYTQNRFSLNLGITQIPNATIPGLS
jgi:hypothetical protein